MALQDDLKKAEAALADKKVKSYTYKGRKYSLTELRDELIPELKELVKAELAEEAQAEAIIASGNLTLRKAKEAVDFYERALETNRNAFAKGNLSEAELADTEAKLMAAQSRVAELEGTTAPSAAPVTLPPAGSPAEVAAARALLREGERTVTTPVTEIVTDDDAEDDDAEDGDDPIITTDKGKKKGSGKGKKKQKATGTGPMGLTVEVRKAFAEQFPEFASNFDGGEAEQAFVDFFGSDLIAIWVKHATTDAYDLSSEAGKAAYLRDVENTQYGQRTNQAQQDFDFNVKNQNILIKNKRNEITKSYADLQLTESQLDEVAREAARNGYTGDDLRFTLYNYAYRGGLATTTDTALADQIRAIGRSYGYTVSEDKLKAALTGTAYNGRMVTQESLLQEAQAAAKGQYGHLADQIDSGLTLDDIFYNYKTFAARTLGIDPSEIDYSKDSRFAEAFGTKETGQLSLNDWVYKLKSDKRYGYQFSPQAQQEVSSVVSTLEKAFGFRQ